MIGIWPRHKLVDGSDDDAARVRVLVQGRGLGAWRTTAPTPTIEVDNAPQDRAAGRDRQLEVAVATALEAIARDGVARPDFGPRPQLAAPPLPPRPARPAS